MRHRLWRLLAALLLVLPPLQAFAGASMASCTHAAADTTRPDAGMPCHDGPARDNGVAVHEAVPDLGAWSACGGCAQCHACSASVLPMAARHTSFPSSSQSAFAPPAAIAGVVLEHLDPPPVG